MSLTPFRPWLPVCAGTGAPCLLPLSRSLNVTGLQVSQAAEQACCGPTAAGMPLAAAGAPSNSSCGAAHHKLLLLLLPCSGEGCALHPAYASYALNKSSDDVVAQYVSNSLACATATDKGEQQQLGATPSWVEPLGCGVLCGMRSLITTACWRCLNRLRCCLLLPVVRVLQGSASQPASATGILPSATASRAVSCRTMRCCPCSCAACSSSTSQA